MTVQGPDGTPQPASQAMSREEAYAVSERSGAQLVPFPAADGNWYVYEAKPTEPPDHGSPAVREP